MAVVVAVMVSALVGCAAQAGCHCDRSGEACTADQDAWDKAVAFGDTLLTNRIFVAGDIRRAASHVTGVRLVSLIGQDARTGEVQLVIKVHGVSAASADGDPQTEDVCYQLTYRDRTQQGPPTHVHCP
ncbi:hypothetical protein [Nocardia sp. alder85J]|uniref:hypothetical protein n=1 Tax=Nocardia sp. alder85J TaxID=2862949 RepID=UPI001CD6A974|nr:hypothetical protein [Nocardia sp. alder85J]MCX4098404.1 hypothetical protein [Nocardia sp. alder85J]